MASKALDNAVRAVMDAMPRYGDRMTYAHIKAVIGWPRGYHDITKLARTLVERGLVRSIKREWDRLRHLEVIPVHLREAARAAAQVSAAPQAPDVSTHYGHAGPATSPPATPHDARMQRLARLREEAVREMAHNQALREEIAQQEEAARADRRRAALEEEQRDRCRQEAEQGKAAFSAPVKGRGPGQAGPLADESTAQEAARRAQATLVLDDICGAEVYGAWGARKPAAC